MHRLQVVTSRDRSCTLAVSPAYGQFGLLRLKSVPELRNEIAAYDARRPEAFAPLKEVGKLHPCSGNSD